MNHHAIAILKKWGITPEAALAFGRRWEGDGFTFPSGKDCRTRKLFAQPNANGQKVTWVKGDQRPQAVLFGFDQLPSDCTRVYITNGEKSTLVHYGLGLPSVSTFGEGNRAQEAAKLLQERGIASVVVIPDCDRKGLEAAQKWQIAAKHAGLECVVLDLRLYLEKWHGMTAAEYAKWDTRDLWLLLNQDATDYRAALSNLPALDFARYAEELPEPKPERPRRAYTVNTDNGIDFAALYEQWQWEIVIPTLERVRPSNKGIHEHRYCPNPNHVDQHPSFRIGEKNAPICTCHSSISWDMLAEWVGAISWSDYKHEYLVPHCEAALQDRVAAALDLAPESTTNVICLSERFITNADLNLTAPGCYALKSPIGTAKTELIARSIQPGEHVLIISHRITLAAALNQRMNDQHDLGFDYYRDFSGPTTRDYLRSAPRLIISYNSLPKLLDENGNLPAHYDRLILDEGEQGLEHLTGGTFARLEGVIALAILSQLVKTIPCVIAADAGLTHLTTDWLTCHRNDVTRIWNTYHMERGKMYIYSEKAPLYMRLLRDLECADLPIVIATDSKTEAKTLHQLLQDKGFHGVCIHAENKDNPENRAFLADLDNQLAKVDYLVHSPTIDAGIDIQAEVECVYGIFINRSVTAPVQLQMMGRARKARYFVVFSARVREHAEINPAKIKAQYIHNLARNHHALGLPLEWDEHGNVVLDDKRNAYLDLVVKVEGKRAALLQLAHKTFKRLASLEFVVTEIEPTEEPNADEIAVNDLVKEARKTRQQLDMEAVINADPISETEFRRLQIDGKATAMIHAGYERWDTEHFYKQAISEPLYKERHNANTGGKKRLERFVLAHKPSEILRMRDVEQTRGENWTADHKRDLNTTRIPAIAEALSAFGVRFFTGARFNKNSQEFGLLLIEFELKCNELDIKRLFNRRTNHVNDDPYKERLKLLRWVLSLLGLRLKLWRSRNIGSEAYSLDMDRYQGMTELANTRLAGLDDPQRIAVGDLLRNCAVKTIAGEVHEPVTDSSQGGFTRLADKISAVRGNLSPSERLRLAGSR